MRRRKVIGQRQTDEWDPVIVDGIQFQAGVYARAHCSEVRFTRSQDRRFRHEPDFSTEKFTSIAFRKLAVGQTAFVGMYVGRDLRGGNIGRQLFRYFMGTAPEKGLPITTTSKVNKPLLALLLQREGFTPYSENCQAEIMPPTAPGNLAVPQVRFLRRDIPSELIVDRSKHGRFYEIAPHDAVRKIPVDLSRVVFLHTGFRPPAIEAA
jgi:hypothetical protein